MTWRSNGGACVVGRAGLLLGKFLMFFMKYQHAILLFIVLQYLDDD